MSSSTDTPPKKVGKPGGKAASAAPAKGQDMGNALRSVYQQTVEEQVPDEMMDLLGKLG